MIKTKCVVEYLKHDYTSIIKHLCIPLIAIVLIACTVISMPTLNGIFTSLIAAIPVLSEFDYLNISATIIVLIFTVGMSIFGTKQTFEYESWKENSSLWHS